MKKLIFPFLFLITINTFANDGAQVKYPNPAATNCLALGGELEKVVTPAGEDANCVIEEWYLYDQMRDRGRERPCPTTHPIRLPNPAACNCIAISGIIRAVTHPEGEDSMCVVGQWPLFRAINADWNP